MSLIPSLSLNAIAASSNAANISEEGSTSSYPKPVPFSTMLNGEPWSEGSVPSFDREDITFSFWTNRSISAEFKSSEEAAKWWELVQNQYPFSECQADHQKGQKQVVISIRPGYSNNIANAHELVYSSGIRLGKNKQYPRQVLLYESMEDHFDQTQRIGGTAEVKIGTFAPKGGKFQYVDKTRIRGHLPSAKAVSDWWNAVRHIFPFNKSSCYHDYPYNDGTFWIEIAPNDEKNIVEFLQIARLPIMGVPPKNIDVFIDANPKEVYRVGDHQYRLTKRIIGEGCFGKVRLAEDVFTEEHVAIKILNDDKDREDEVLKKIQEAGGHPNIVGYIDSGKVWGKTWIAMEYLKGQVEGVFAKRHAWTNDLRSQYQSALNFLRAKGIPAYRENESENIMIIFKDGKPQVKLIDFGTRVPGSNCDISQ